VSSSVRVILQYVFLLALTAFLVWFSLQGLKNTDGGKTNSWEVLQEAWGTADKSWLFAMAVVAFISHFIRAERWKMLILPSGHQTNVTNSFLSLMVGYLVNLVIPRGGEVSRCYNLYKLDKTPVEISFGTVVTERIIDVICLFILIAISFIQESTKLLGFIDTLPINLEGTSKLPLILLIGFLVVAAFSFTAFLVLRRNEKIKAFFIRTFTGFKQGLLSVFKLKSPGLFIFYSVLIWGLYFLMSYTVIQAFPSTKVLGLNAVLSLFAIGAIAMAAPLPAGTGSYHVLVPQGLIFLYNIPRNEAVAFTFIFHGWQTVIMIIGGAISLILTNIIIKKNKRLE
jgi:glycosyltransferase 2 family protein